MNEVAGNFTPEEEDPFKRITFTELAERFHTAVQDDEELSDLFHSEKAIQVLPGKRAFEAGRLRVVPDVAALPVCTTYYIQRCHFFPTANVSHSSERCGLRNPLRTISNVPAWLTASLRLEGPRCY